MSVSSTCRRFGCVVVAVAVLALSACSDDDESPSTTPATTAPPSTAPSTTVAPTTTGVGSNVESLSYLIQTLLTTEQIGGGWVDQGRNIVPPGSNQLTGFLCPDAETIITGFNGALDPQVSTSFRRPGDVGLSVFESVMWGNRDDLTAMFAKFADAVRSCAGSTYKTDELGELRVVIDEAPEVGVSAFSFHFEPASPQTENPWITQRFTSVLLSDPNEPVALVVGVGTVNLYSPPEFTSTKLDDTEYLRIVTAAVNRIIEGV